MAVIVTVCSLLTLLLLVQDGVCQISYTEGPSNSTIEFRNLTEPDIDEVATVTIEVTQETIPAAAPTEPTYVKEEEIKIQPEPDFGIRYYLYTRDHPKSYIGLGNDSVLNDTGFDIGHPTIFVIHGFTGSGDTTSVTLIKDAILFMEDVNVVSVHWEDLAKGPNYEVAVNNCRVVAAHLAKTIERLVTEEGVLLDTIHVIGFSLGAQVAGIAGSLLTIGKLPRITALDPAGPSFHKKTDQWRLDANDAEFVLVLHTSGGIISFEQPLGHVDFYPNGGTSPQPACVEQTSKLVCSHLIAPLYFTQSIYNPEGFAATKCNSWTAFTEGLCSGDNTVYLGLHTPSSVRGKFFLRTGAQEPFGLGPNPYISENTLDSADRREGRTREIKDNSSDGDAYPYAQAKGSSGPQAFETLMLTACVALLKSWLPKFWQSVCFV